MGVNQLEFANFLCHFGQDKVLLDYADTIIIPAFMDENLIRKRGKEAPAEYLFYKVSLVSFVTYGGSKQIGVFGQFIKNVNLTRTQVFDRARGLVQDARSMESSPSATFLLVLDTHYLVYLPTTPFAPSLGEFESTIRKFAAIKHKTYIEKLYQGGKDRSEKITKKKLLTLHPAPFIDVIHLATPETIAQFIQRFEILREAHFRLLRPNGAFRAAEAFPEMREVLEELNANSAGVVARNHTDGLDKQKVGALLGASAATGLEDVTLKGKARDGSDLSGSNKDFKVVVPLDSVPQTRPKLIEKLVQVLEGVAPSAASSHLSPDHKRKLNDIAKDAK